MKKIIALLLALVLTLSMVACTGSKTSVSENTEAPTDSTAAGIYTNPPWDGALPLVKDDEDNVITIGLRASANALDYDTNEFTLWVEEKTGLDLQFITFAGSAFA